MENATNLIKDGQRIRVHGTEGHVETYSGEDVVESIVLLQMKSADFRHVDLCHAGSKRGLIPIHRASIQRSKQYMGLLNREFYNRDALIVAAELLGKTLVHEMDGHKISVKIVEAEAYMGIRDQAAHSYGGRRTQRVEVMYGGPGFSYVFFVYGMHYCFNVVTREKGNPQAVLIRAAEPMEGLDIMAQKRFGKPYSQLSKSQIKNLTNGPGKLCRALSIDKDLNGEDLCGRKLYVEEGKNEKFRIVSAKRVGIDYAGEAKDYLWRFYIEGNAYVSVK